MGGRTTRIKEQSKQLEESPPWWDFFERPQITRSKSWWPAFFGIYRLATIWSASSLMKRFWYSSTLSLFLSRDGILMDRVAILIGPQCWGTLRGYYGKSNGEYGPESNLEKSFVFYRNVSSAGDYGRKKLRECEGLVDSVLYLVKKAIEKAYIDNKSVENCVCVLRNLSYRAQEVEDPNYDKKQLMVPGETRAGAKPNSDNLGCFGAGKAKRKDSISATPPHPSSSSRTGSNKGMDLLWQPEVVQPYMNLLSNCSNPETLEAAAGAIQNLSACYWQPSIDIRTAVRQAKGLPILVELLRMEVDKVVCAVATALRNLAIDQRNKALIGTWRQWRTHITKMALKR